MAIRKRKQCTETDWGYVFDAPGSTKAARKQIAKWGFTTRKKAQDAEADHRIKAKQEFEAATTARTKPIPKTLGGLLEEFLDKHAAKNLAPKTTERYRQMAPYLSAELLAMPLPEVTALHLHREWNRLREGGGHVRTTGAVRPLNPKTVRNIAGLVSSAFGQGIFWGLCQVNPARESRPPRTKKKESVAFTVDQQLLLIEGSGHWQLPMILELCAATGARRGEILALRWSDIHEESLFVGRSISQTKEGMYFKEPKNGKFREIAVPASTLKLLADHRGRQFEFRRHFGPDYRVGLDLVFGNEEGSPLRPDSISAAVSNLRRRLKLPPGASLHTLRHTHGSHLLAAGMELPAVSARLGHTNVYVTASVYSHALTGRDKEAAKKWEEFQGRKDGLNKGVQQ